MDARGKAEKLLQDVQQEISAVAKGRCSPDEAHDVRVAIRRFEQSLEVFEPCLKRGGVRKLKKKVRKVRRAAGGVRDLDIAKELLVEAGVRTPAFVGKDRREAAAKLKSAAKSWKEDPELLRLRKQSPPAGDVVRNFVDRLLEEYAQAGAEAAQRDAASDGEALHRFRLVTKRLRYSMELIAGEDDKPDPRLHDVQQLLGSISDCHAVTALLGGRVPEMDAFLKRRLRRQMSQFKRYWNRKMEGKLGDFAVV